jgi:lysine 2,3-aminomutase
MTDIQYNDWRWQLKNLITTPEQLAEYVKLSDGQLHDIERSAMVFPLAITPYYASLMEPDNPDCPVRRQAIPSINELDIAPEEQVDPLGEELDSPVPGLTHRYPDRALLLVTNRCFVFCRHCNRRRKVGDPARAITGDSLDLAFSYIERTPQIREVLVSGGDPFFLSTAKLEHILKRLSSIDHVKVIRIGTRVPVVLPQRITSELVLMLKKYHPVWINTHFNHPREITGQSRAALAKLADAGIPLGNQTVLLKGINDCPAILKDLFLKLVENRVRPYYLFQCDLARGTAHFRTPVSRGIEIMESLIGHISGYAVPVYAVDPPGGAGKIRLQPNYQLSSAPGAVVLRNYEGVITRYTEPDDISSGCPQGCDICNKDTDGTHRKGAGRGVSSVLEQGGSDELLPLGMQRTERRKFFKDS